MCHSHWRVWISNPSWLRRAPLRLLPMTCCLSSVTMALLAVSCIYIILWNVATQLRTQIPNLFIERRQNVTCGVFWIKIFSLSWTGGHYIAYSQNVINGQWYEFDDQYVTEVHETVVQNAEAYVLFYRYMSYSTCFVRWRVQPNKSASCMKQWREDHHDGSHVFMSIIM